MLKIVDNNGECNLDDLTKVYRYFYKNRIEKGKKVDRDNCPLSNINYLNDDGKIKKSILANPFEKFERKKFMYHSKDLNHISFSMNLWSRISPETDKIKNHFFKDLYQQHHEMTYKIFIFFLYISSKIEFVAMAMHYILEVI